MAVKVIPVSTPSAAYQIHVGSGLLAKLYPRLKKLAAGKPFRPFLVTSPAIWELWSDRVRASFPELAHPTVLLVPPGEKHKRLATIESLADQLAAAGADRDALLLAFGGGVIGDMTGFLAAVYMRGVPCVQIPTTLLAQVDSSVGGKTGVNLKAGKNLVGSFHQPRAVFTDPDLLTTLPASELRAGLQEAVKAAIIRDLKFFTYLKQNADALAKADATVLTRVVTRAVEIKAQIVSQDEHENGLRMILNFGHTIGHAIEAATGYRKLLHGEAVAWGSIAALHLSLGRGAISTEDFARMANLILRFGPLPRFRATPEDLVRLTASDKKARSGRRAFILATGIGSVEVVYDVRDEELTRATQAMLDDMRASGGKVRP